MEIHEGRLRLSDPDSLSVTPRCLALAADMLKAKVSQQRISNRCFVWVFSPWRIGPVHLNLRTEASFNAVTFGLS